MCVAACSKQSCTLYDCDGQRAGGLKPAFAAVMAEGQLTLQYPSAVSYVRFWWRTTRSYCWGVRVVVGIGTVANKEILHHQKTFTNQNLTNQGYTWHMMIHLLKIPSPKKVINMVCLTKPLFTSWFGCSKKNCIWLVEPSFSSGMRPKWLASCISPNVFYLEEGQNIPCRKPICLPFGMSWGPNVSHLSIVYMSPIFYQT